MFDFIDCFVDDFYGFRDVLTFVDIAIKFEIPFESLTLPVTNLKLLSFSQATFPDSAAHDLVTLLLADIVGPGFRAQVAQFGERFSFLF